MAKRNFSQEQKAGSAFEDHQCNSPCRQPEKVLDRVHSVFLINLRSLVDIFRCFKPKMPLSSLFIHSFFLHVAMAKQTDAYSELLFHVFPHVYSSDNEHCENVWLTLLHLCNANILLCLWSNAVLKLSSSQVYEWRVKA